MPRSSGGPWHNRPSGPHPDRLRIPGEAATGLQTGPNEICYTDRMAPSNPYHFRKVSGEDRDLLTDWLSRPHVRKWWRSDTPHDANALSDPRVARWIVSTLGQPFAFAQDYSVHGWPDHHFASLPIGARGMDQYIGPPEMIGKGHGSGFIAARMLALFDQGAPVIATDPHPENSRAIAVYKKLGFAPFGPPRHTPWGAILPMRATS